MKLVFATGNKNKLREIAAILNESITLQGLDELGFTEDIEEPFDTLEENAEEKARFISEKFQVNCFADDTGLEVEALNGEPGVLSARYAGEAKSADDNMEKLLRELEGETNRKAQFRTVIALVLNGEKHQFEGIVDGEIVTERFGGEGFGYDPVFKPNGYDRTFAEMTLEEKNEISHRARAVRKLASFLNGL